MRAGTVKYLAVALLFLTIPAWSQEDWSQKSDIDWEVSLSGGVFTGETVMQTYINGDPVKAKTDNGGIVAMRVSGEQEMFGVEMTLAGVFQDMEVKSLPGSGISSDEDASMFLFGLNALVFPTGNQLLDGRIRPFITAGPGFAVLDSGFSEVSNEILFDMNAGAGVKFLLGEDEGLLLRFDWRWHYMLGSGGMEDNLYQQEFSVGIGYRF